MTPNHRVIACPFGTPEPWNTAVIPLSVRTSRDVPITVDGSHIQ